MIRELKQRLEAEHHGRKRKKIIVERNLFVTPLARPGSYTEAPAGKRFVIEYVGASITQPTDATLLPNGAFLLSTRIGSTTVSHDILT